MIKEWTYERIAKLSCSECSNRGSYLLEVTSPEGATSVGHARCHTCGSRNRVVVEVFNDEPRPYKSSPTAIFDKSVHTWERDGMTAWVVQRKNAPSNNPEIRELSTMWRSLPTYMNGYVWVPWIPEDRGNYPTTDDIEAYGGVTYVESWVERGGVVFGWDGNHSWDHDHRTHWTNDKAVSETNDMVDSILRAFPAPTNDTGGEG